MIADWVPLETPPNGEDLRSQFIHLLELECIDPSGEPYPMNVYMHRSGEYAISEVEIGCGYQYDITRINRRDDEDRRDWAARSYTPIERDPFDDRRDTDSLTFEAFLARHGNGEADG